MCLEKRSSLGFTLVEILIVIGIIGILASVIMGSLKAARQQAYQARTLAGFKQLATALEKFAGDNGGEYIRAT